MTDITPGQGPSDREITVSVPIARSVVVLSLVGR